MKQFRILLWVPPYLTLLLLFCYIQSVPCFSLSTVFVHPPLLISHLSLLFIPLLFTLWAPHFLISLFISLLRHSSPILYLFWLFSPLLPCVVLRLLTPFRRFIFPLTLDMPNTLVT